MLSDKPHINIDRNNYEEFFLLYLDGELSPEEQQAVEAFAALHPDLSEELDVLLTTKLDSEPLLYSDKESLLSHHIKGSFIDDNLLLFLDGELPATEAEKVAQRIKTEKDYNEQYAQLKKATLDSAETIPCPFKKELYHITEKEIRPIFWLRVAVAVILVLSGGVFWLSQNQSTQNLPPVVASKPVQNKPVKTNQQTNTIINNKIKVQEEVAALAEKNTITPVIIKEETAVAKQTTQNKKPLLPNNFLLKETTQKSNSTELALVNEPPAVGNKKSVAINVSIPQQTFNKPPVTTVTSPAYTTIETAATETGISYAVAANNNEKKGSVRGFLRKATRFIERRTGINPVNENDELLIGVVAIKL